jgi:hypothetical protein
VLQVREGEIPQSARAITSEELRKLYHFNHKNENWDIKGYKGPTPRNQKSTIHEWGTPLLRRLLQVVMIIAFLCLLRSDEVLKIRREHVQFLNNPRRIKLTLPFRKTHQGGGTVLLLYLNTQRLCCSLNAGIKPFYLYELPEHEAHLCPVRALAAWIAATKITSGYLFRRMATGDRPRQDDTPMVRRLQRC